MFRLCVLAVFGCAFASPQYQIHQQQDEGIPPHLLRQYIGVQGQGQQHRAAPIPAPARLAYNVQEEQYQQRPQYQPQPQSQPQPQPQPQAQPQPQQYRQQQQQQPEDFDHNPSYQFGFDVSDDQFTNYQNRKEQRDGDVIKGSYSVVDSDGFIRTVTYTADPKEGFKAEVSRQPTDIVVKIPTPKPQTLSAPQQISHQQHQPQLQQQQLQQQQLQQQQLQHQPQVSRQPSPQQQYYRYE